ncbi:MAG: hypothetical protein ACF8R7_11255 [Phycisphaerales bacterium JB039]
MSTLRTRLDDRDRRPRTSRDQRPTPAFDSGADEGPQPVDHSSVKGLCRSCERRFDCTFPVTEAGVWSCDEYE